MIKVLIADDHPIFTDGVKAFLEKEPDIQVVAEALNGKEVLQKMETQEVDVAVLDISMPEMNGVEATKHIRDKYPDCKVLILSMDRERDVILQLISLGINGYILKNKGKEELISAIQTVYRGGTYFPMVIWDEIKKGPIKSTKSTTIVNLTTREKEILGILAKESGLSYKEIGDRLNITEVTVQTHVRNIKAKLGLKKRGQLIKFAIDNQIKNNQA